MTTKEHAVLIAGGGPTGLMLGAALARMEAASAGNGSAAEEVPA